jgi:hypothetical protein
MGLSGIIFSHSNPLKMKNILFLYKTMLLLSYFMLYTSHFATAQPNRDKYRDKVWLFGYEGQNHVQGQQFPL